MFTNFQQTVDFLYKQLPAFQKYGKKALKYDLSNITAIAQRLNNPQNNFKSIHIAGTNGKGSVAHMLAAILQEKGLKVGIYSSPHLIDLTERIKINGRNIPKNHVIDFVNENSEILKEVQPSFFEWMFAMAIDYFSREKVDFAIIETGLGGRLDSTNIIQPILSVITNIGYDHQNVLGNTLAEIAGEKAGIIKKNIPVIIGEKQSETTPVFVQKAKEKNAEIYFTEDDYKIENQETVITEQKPKQLIRVNSDKYELDLMGDYQSKNLITVLKIIECFNQIVRNDFKIEKETVKTALQNVRTLTNLQGRWQIIQKKPLAICDVAHNFDGIKMVLSQLEKLNKKIHFVLGFSSDKDIEMIFDILPKESKYYWCQANVMRAMSLEIIEAKARLKGLHSVSHNTVMDAYNDVLSKTKENELIFVGGSVFVVADLLIALQKQMSNA